MCSLFLVAKEILLKFDDNDWSELLTNILSKSIEWQTRYAYCIDIGINYENAVKSLIMLTKIENEELFITVVDSLRCIINIQNSNIIESNDTLTKRVEELIPRCGVASKKILEDFITKVQN